MIISVVNTKGGVGKSTLSVHLACWLRQKGLRVGLVDSDRQASSSTWLQQAAPEIATYPITTAHEILTQIPAISGDYDVLVADAPAALGAEIASLVTVSDLCLMPIGASMLDVWASYRTARIIYRVRFRGRPRREVAAYCVLNRVVPKAPVTQVAAAAIHHFGFPVALSTVRFREAYLEAASRRTTVQKLGRAGRHASLELAALFNEVLALDDGSAAGVSSGAAVLEAGQAGTASD